MEENKENIQTQIVLQKLQFKIFLPVDKKSWRVFCFSTVIIYKATYTLEV